MAGRGCRWLNDLLLVTQRDHRHVAQDRAGLVEGWGAARASGEITRHEHGFNEEGESPAYTPHP